MSAKARTKPRKRNGIESGIKQYLYGIMFIAMGLFIISAITYIASAIPQVSFPSQPPPKDPYNGNYPGSPFMNTTVNVNNTDSYNVKISGSSAGNTYVIVVDISGLNANITKITAVIGWFFWGEGSYTQDLTLSYKCNYVITSVYVPPDPAVMRWLDSITLYFNQNTSGSFRLFIYQNPPDNTDPSANLVCESNSQFALTNTLFIDFIGWSFGIVMVIAGLTRLGLKL